MYDAILRPVEILACVPGKRNGEPIIALVVRADPENSFAVTDVAISKAQAARLLEDLTSILGAEQPIWSEEN